MAAPSGAQLAGVDQSISQNPGQARPGLTTRKSSSMHQTLLTKLRPLPFQYVWAVWFAKSEPSGASSRTVTPAASPTSANPDAYDDRLSVLATSVPDIAAFYRIYNNFPWDSIKLKDSVHVFRQGVKPQWEDPENLDGGGWVLKVRRDDEKAVKAWEEICLMGCGGELQASVQEERDHILGMSYSPRLYWAHITIWNKQGNNTKSIELLQQTVLDRLSPDLRPQSSREYYYKKHSDHEGWEEAIGKAKEVK